MNKKIKQLATQCDAVILKDMLPTKQQYVFLDDDLERFVNLILAEAIQVMETHDYHGTWLGEKVKEHFGVI